MKHLLTFILSILLLSACGESQRNSQLLERAESIMNDSCEVALSILQDSIDTTTLTTERGRAIYALLLSQALDKNYIDITSDSIIAPAVEFFADVTIDDDSQSVHYAMLTNFYLGRIHLNNYALSNSLIHLLKAEQFALHLNDHLYLGLIYSALAYTNNLGHNPYEDLKYTQLAYNHFKETGIKTYSDYALRDLAIAQNNCHKFNESQISFNMLLNDSSIQNDSLFLLSILPQYAKLQYNQSKLDSMKHTILSLDSLGYKYTATESALLATAYINENNLANAKSALDNTNKAISINDSIAILNALIEFNLKNNDYKSAYNNLDLFVKIQTKTNYSIWEQSLMGVHRDFVNEQAKNANLEVESKKNQIILIVIISVAILFIAIFIIYALRMKNKVQKERINRILNEHYQSQNLISNAENRISELEALLENETDKSQRLINELAIQKESLQLFTQQEKLREEATNAIETSDVATRFRKALDENANPTKDDWEQLDNYINLQFPGFKSVLYKLVKLSEIEYQVCLLLKSKFTPTEIGRLVNLSKSGLGNARKRLFVKAFKTDGTATDWDKFIASL